MEKFILLKAGGGGCRNMKVNQVKQLILKFPNVLSQVLGNKYLRELILIKHKISFNYNFMAQVKCLTIHLKFVKISKICLH